MSAFSKLVNPVPAAYPTAPHVDLTVDDHNFVPDEYQFVNEGAVAVDVSFDGVNDHDRVPIPSASVPESITHRTKARKVWFKGNTGIIRTMVRTDV